MARVRIRRYWLSGCATMTLALLLALLPGARPARAVGFFNVNSTLDERDASPGNGTCSSTPSSKCTLRAAIQEANATPGTDTINFAIPGTG